MKKPVLLALWLTSLSAGAVSAAATRAPLTTGQGQSWSVIGGRTLGVGGRAIEGGLGFPGVHVSYLHGLTPRLDLGGRLVLNYAFEGVAQNPVPGFKPQLLVRLRLLDNQQVSLAFVFEPGPLMYFPLSGQCVTDPAGNRLCNTGTFAGLALPIGLHLGIAASSALNAVITVDIPLWISFGPKSALQIPVLIGGGVEYFVKSNLLLYAQLKMGPTLSSAGSVNGKTAAFAFEGKVGLAYRF